MIAYLKAGNIELSPQAEGFHVNIPFTRETMPPGGMELLALDRIAGFSTDFGEPDRLSAAEVGQLVASR